MKFCRHEWKVWDSSVNVNKGRMYFVIAIAILVAGCAMAGTFGVITILVSLPAVFLIGMNLVYMADLNKTLFSTFLYKDKTCIKCQTHIFDYSIRRKKEYDARNVETSKESIAQNLKGDFEKYRQMRLKA